jgi:hypothetical protein
VTVQAAGDEGFGQLDADVTGVDDDDLSCASMFEVGVEPAGVVDGVQEVNPVRRPRVSRPAIGGRSGSARVQITRRS